MTDTSSGGQAYPGERLGLPQDGSRSVASWLRRGLALFLDWVASSLVAGGFFGYEWFGETAGQQGWVAMSPILVLLVEASVLTALLGGSFGQLVLRIVVVRIDGRPVNLLQALGRTALICLVIPPLIFNRDNRGLHDLAFGTIALNR